MKYKQAYEKLERENARLKYILKETLWMARRYADGRMSYAVSQFNEAIHELDALGLANLHEGDSAEDGKRFADDGMFGRYDPETRKHVKSDEKIVSGLLKGY